MSNYIPEITLNDGLTLPVVGLGTYLLKGNAGVQSIFSAIDMGYRLIDSAYTMKMKERLEKRKTEFSSKRTFKKSHPNYLAVIKRMTKRYNNPRILISCKY